MDIPQIRGLRAAVYSGLAAALLLMITVACGGAAEPATGAPAVESAPIATSPPGAGAKATVAPVATVAAPVMNGVHPGKVTLMSGSFGNERFDTVYGSPGTDTSKPIHGFLVESTVEGGKLVVVPGIASEWEFTEDMKTITFTVREGVKFHDGTELTVEDVLWSLQHYVGPQAPDYSVSSLSLRYGREMDKIEQTGPNQVSVTSKLPIPEYGTYGAQGNPGGSLTKVMPKREHLHDEAEALAYDKNPIGAGIIKLAKHQLGEKMVFERFDDYYFRPDNGFHEDRRLQYSTMEFVLAQDESTRIAAIRAGEADMGRVNLGAREQIEAGGGRLVFSPEARAFQIQPWGCASPDIPCHDIKVRQALAYALDKEKMKNELYGGPEVMQTKGYWLVTPSTTGYTPDLAPYAFDPEKARQLLAEAGYPGGRGFGTLIVDTYISPYIPFMVESAQLAAEFWETELGIEVEVRQHDKTGLGRAKLTTPADFNGHLFWGGNDTRASAAGITKLYYLNRDPEAGYYHHANVELWDIGDKTLATLGKGREAEAFNSLYRRLSEESYYIGVGYINIPWGVGSRIATWEPYPLSMWATAFHTITLK